MICFGGSGSDCIGFFEGLVTRAQDAEMLANARSALAQAYFLEDRVDEARRCMHEAVSGLQGISNEEVVARTLGRAAYVCLYSEDLKAAEHFARRALDLAGPAHQYVTAIGALSVLYSVACERGRVDDALEHLLRLGEYSTYTGNLDFQLYALTGSYELYAERYDLQGISRCESALASFDLHYDTNTTLEALLPARALQCAWRGEFDRAYALLAPSASQQRGADWKAQRHAELALYAAASERDADASSHLDSAEEALGECASGTHAWTQTHVLIGLAYSLKRRTAEAERCFESARSSTAQYQRLAKFVDAARELHRRLNGAVNHAALFDALHELIRLAARGLLEDARADSGSGPPQSGEAGRMNAQPSQPGAVSRDCAALERVRREAAAEILCKSATPGERTVLAGAFIDMTIDCLIESRLQGDSGFLSSWLDRAFAQTLPAPPFVIVQDTCAVLEAMLLREGVLDPALRAVLRSGADKAARRRRAERKIEDTRAIDETDARINDLIAKLESADVLTAEHCRAVASWCSRIARRLGLNEKDVTLLTRSGLLHDIGKLKIPKDVLNAPRALNAAEWRLIRGHAAAGEALAKKEPLLRETLPAIRSHHERFDGGGYPDGLRGEAIPFIARVVTVADCFNAMIGRRPYRPPLPPSVALEELRRNRGRQFDPEVVEAMEDVVLRGR